MNNLKNHPRTPPNTRFISTAIPYVNASPHLGFALELLLADVQARQARRKGERVYFLTGSDDNSLKNALAAEAAGLSTQDFVDQHVAQFQALAPLLNLSCTDFIATSQDPRHAPAVEKLWRACAANGDIYSDEYEGLYCVGCEAFLDASELTADNLCPEHFKAPEQVAERNYFFRLSRYQEQLQSWLTDGTLNIQPSQRRNEVLSFLQTPLRDLSISRSRERARGWGIPVPGDPSQVVYVWFDALANYISALGYAEDKNTALTEFWHQATQIQHVIGKGVLRFHAVYWPAILHSAAIRVPTDLLVHGYITLDGQKISKSLGNIVSPDEAVDYFGVEALRYFLLRHVGSVADGNFSRARLEEVYNTELANQLGNLVSRVCALGIRHQLTWEHNPENSASETSFPEFVAVAGPRLLAQVDHALDTWQPHRALTHIWQAVDAANSFVSRHEPWVLAKAGQTEQLELVLTALYQALHSIGQALAPLLPDTSAKIAAALRNRTQAPSPLFPKRSESL